MNDVADDRMIAAGPPLFPPADRLLAHEITTEQLLEQRIYGFQNAETRARPFKLLRSQIAKRVQEGGLKLIGVTSPAPQVGKSFVAANLAAALSRLGEVEVCLVDLDLHRPALASRFSIPDGPGIHDFLGGQIEDLAPVARRINDERLVVVPGFKRRRATGELLTSAMGDRLFSALRALPDSTLVLIDMPPIFADDDAVIIGQRLDGFIMVVEDGRSTRKQARDTIRTLQPTPLLGTVLNRYKAQLFTDDYGYGVSYGYGAYY